MACDFNNLLLSHAAKDFEELKRRVTEYLANPAVRFENMMVIVSITNSHGVCTEQVCAMCWTDFQPFFKKLSEWMRSGGHIDQGNQA